MKIILSIISVIFLSFTTSNFVLINNIKSKGDFFTVDKLGYIYIINNDILSKFDVKGNLLKTYNNKNAGEISFVDVSDPLKILVFHKNFAKIVFLDNTLSIKGEPISLEDMELEQSILACSSYENAFWLYDSYNLEIIRIDESLKIAQRSGNIVQITGREINPNYITENNNFIYLNNPKTGILIFDRYGTYLKTIPFKNLNSFQIINDKIIYQKNDSILKIYNFKTLEETSIELPEKKSKGINFYQKNIYILNDSGVSIYSVL